MKLPQGYSTKFNSKKRKLLVKDGGSFQLTAVLMENPKRWLIKVLYDEDGKKRSKCLEALPGWLHEVVKKEIEVDTKRWQLRDALEGRR
jgi:hypothetical protein